MIVTGTRTSFRAFKLQLTRCPQSGLSPDARGHLLQLFRLWQNGLSSVSGQSDHGNHDRGLHTANGDDLDGQFGEPKNSSDAGRWHSWDPQKHPLAALSSDVSQSVGKELETVQIFNKSPVYKQKLNSEGQAFATGSRKRSRARVWLRTGSGEIFVNGLPWVDYFRRLDHRDKILRPFGLLNLMGKMDVTCEVSGGGSTGQAEAVRHAVSRALQNWNPLFRGTLKENGLLTRDSREVESKKYGRKKARKAFQWVKR